MPSIFHSVTLEDHLCLGCTNCIKRCPTEAIRVRNGKAIIIGSRCIDCGECIRICPHHAKRAVSDGLGILKKFQHTIALVPPSLYGQFPKLTSPDQLNNAILALGFDEVYEVSRAAEMITDATRQYIKDPGTMKPIINSACPTIMRLIQIRFPDLIDYFLPLIQPSELSAIEAKKKAAAKTGLPPEQIGAVFLAPCPAKVTAAKNPIGIEKSQIDGSVAINEIYPQLLSGIGKYSRQEPSKTGGRGVRWGASGGEASSVLNENYIAADGIENCIRVLESLENQMYKSDLEFIELNACPGGCVGGVLAAVNPFISIVKLKSIIRDLPGRSEDQGEDVTPDSVRWSKPFVYQPVMELDTDIAGAMEKLSEIDEIEAKLQGLDCGSCGSPSCRAFAEDIIMGFCSINECIFVLRESLHNIAETIAGLHALNKNIKNPAADNAADERSDGNDR